MIEMKNRDTWMVKYNEAEEKRVEAQGKIGTYE